MGQLGMVQLGMGQLSMGACAVLVQVISNKLQGPFEDETKKKIYSN